MSNPAFSHMSARNWFLLLLLALIWGSSFLFTNIAVREMPPLTLVLLRTGIAALVLVIVMKIQGHSFQPFIKRPFPFFLFGMLNCALPFFMIAYGQQHIGPGLGGILNATVPIFIVPLAHFMTRDEKMTPLKVSGVAIGFIGVVVLIGADALAGFGSDVKAELGGVIASVSYALGGIYARSFKDTPSIVTTTGGLLASSLLILPLALYFDNSPQLAAPSSAAWGAILAMALLTTAFAFVLFYGLVAKVGAMNSSLVAYMIPISAILLGFLFRNEVLSLNSIMGMAIIAISLVVIDGRLFRRSPSRAILMAENSHDGTITK